MLCVEARECPSGEVPLVFVPVGTPGGHPPMRNKRFLGPYKAPKGTDTKVTSAKGRFCAYPIHNLASRRGGDRSSAGRSRSRT